MCLVSSLPLILTKPNFKTKPHFFEPERIIKKLLPAENLKLPADVYDQENGLPSRYSNKQRKAALRRARNRQLSQKFSGTQPTKHQSTTGTLDTQTEMNPVMQPQKLLPRFPVRSPHTFTNFLSQHFKHGQKNFSNVPNENFDAQKDHETFNSSSNVYSPKRFDNEINTSQQKTDDTFYTFVQDNENCNNLSNEDFLPQESQNLQMHNIQMTKVPIPKVMFNRFFETDEEETRNFTPVCVSPQYHTTQLNLSHQHLKIFQTLLLKQSWNLKLIKL